MFSLLYKLKLNKARKLRREAQRAYESACARKDCRDMHSAMLGLSRATAAVLQLETKRRWA